MTQFCKATFLLKTLPKKCYPHGRVVFFSSTIGLKQVPRPILRVETSARRIGPYGWFMLLIPTTSFGLGVWQIQRKAWKEELIETMNTRMSSAPIQLPHSLEEINKLEYQPVHVRGTFLHDQEMLIGPRLKIDDDDFDIVGHRQGFLIVTPFKLEDRDQTILINRGWVPRDRARGISRPEGQIEGTVDVIGVIRLREEQPWGYIKDLTRPFQFMYRDLDGMCALTGASPILLDQTVDYNVAGGPVGGQTRVNLRNEHLSYIITWFSLGAATSYMWLKKFVLK